MDDGKKTVIELIKLSGGGRLIRLADPVTGIAIEKMLDPSQAVASQKKRLQGVFNAALEQAKALAV